VTLVVQCNALYKLACNSTNLADSKKKIIYIWDKFLAEKRSTYFIFQFLFCKSYYFQNDKIKRAGCIL